MYYDKKTMKTISGKINWIDILNPTKKDVDHLRAAYRFHPIILDELLMASAHSRVESYDDYLYMTYHLPIYDPAAKTSRRAEVDFLITRDTVITVHYEPLEPLEGLEESLNANEEFSARVLGKNTAVLTYHIVQTLINFSLRQLRHIENNIQSVSGDIFKSKERRLLERISYIKRDVLDYHIISRPQRILLDSLRRAGEKYWGKESDIYLNDLSGDNEKIQFRIENYLEIVESLEETNAQLLNAKMNRSMQTFTVLAFFTFPLVLYTSVFSIANRTTDFWLGFAIVAFVTIIIPLILLKRGKL